VTGLQVANPSALPRVTSLNMLVCANDAAIHNPATYTDNVSLAQAGSNTTMTSSVTFTADDVGNWIQVTNAFQGVNNGIFPVTSRTANTITYINPAGLGESSTPTFTLWSSADSITDRVSGEVYSEATIANQPVMLPCANPGGTWPLAGSNPSRAQLLSRASTAARKLTKTSSSVAGFFNGNITSSIAVYFGSRTTNVPASLVDLLFIGSTTNGIRVQMNWSTSTAVLSRIEASTTTSVNVATSFFPTSPVLLGLTYDPSQSLIFPYTYAYGATTVTALSSVATGTLRSPTGMTQIQLLSSSTTGGFGEYVLGWAAGAGIAWGTNQYLEIGKWFGAYVYPNGGFPS
jgi:hypothetical protein